MGSERTIGPMRAQVGKDVMSTVRRASDLGFLGGMRVEDQIDHALGFVAAAEEILGRPPTSAVDLGTGGGVPGVVLHGCWPRCHVVLMDVSLRRTEFLSREVEGWGRPGTTEVVRGRAEELGRHDRFRQHFEVVAARSFGPPPVTAECGAPLLTVGGLLVVSEPPQDPGARRWPTEGLELLGLAPVSQTRFDDRFSYQVLIKRTTTPERYPRRVGIPTKRPIF